MNSKNNEAKQQGPIVLQAQTNNYGSTLYLEFKLGRGKHLYQVHDLNHVVTSSQEFSSIEVVKDEVNDLLYHGSKLYSGNQLVGYTHDTLDLQIQIEENNGSATVIVEKFPASTLITGNDNYYGYYNKVWIKYDGITPKYLTQLGLHPGDKLQFSKKTINQFARQVLPKLEQADYLSITGTKELKASLPPAIHDYRDNYVLCRAQAEYGKQNYVLNHRYLESDIK